MASFPAITGGQVAMYGTSRRMSFPTEVVRYQTGEEQRWVSGQPIAAGMSLLFTELPQYDLSVIRAFYLANAGPFNSTWSITIDGVTYNDMAFEADGFAPVLATVSDTWNLTLRVRQTI